MIYTTKLIGKRRGERKKKEEIDAYDYDDIEDEDFAEEKEEKKSFHFYSLFFFLLIYSFHFMLDLAVTEDKMTSISKFSHIFYRTAKKYQRDG